MKNVRNCDEGEPMKSGVRKWPEMDRRQKIQYLKDYYLLPAVGVILLIAVARGVSLIWHVGKAENGESSLWQ